MSFTLFSLPPPPNTTDITSPVFRDWFYRLQKAFADITEVPWSIITGVPDNLVEIAALTGEGYAHRATDGTWTLDAGAAGGKIYEPVMDGHGNFVLEGTDPDIDITMAWGGDYAS